MSETKPLEISSSVAEATIYRSQAIVTRTAQVTLEPGRQTIFLDQLPHDLNADSVRVAGSGSAEVSIEDFRVVPRYFSEIPAERIQALAEGLEGLQMEKQSLQDQVGVIHQQKEFLQQISVHTTTSIGQDFERKSPDPDSWRGVLGFLGEESNRYNEEQRKLEVRIKKVEDEIKEIQHHLQRNQQAGTRVRQQVQVRIDCEEGGDFTFRVTYLTSHASWSPAYDARVDIAAKSVVLRYFGTLRQNTGEDWKGIQVRFSTARPRISGNPPELSQWTIFEQKPEVYREEAWMGGSGAMMDEDSEAMAPAKMKKSVAMSAVRSAPAPSGRMKEAEVESGEGATVVFTPGASSDIPGDGSDQKLLIMEEEFPNEFQYLTVPRFAPHVYLTSQITNETSFPLLPGRINIFLNGDFVGRSNLRELVATGEKFELNLGIDEAIKVKHELKRKSGDEKGLFNRHRVVNFVYAIQLDNQHNHPETLLVRDHLPVSEEEKIKVKLDHIMPEENPDKNEEELPNGALEWKVQIGAREKARLEYGFTVSHDPGIVLVGL